jgi:hypothetical protein
MMNLIPAADTLPVPWPWFHVLLMVTFPLHIILMNCMVGSIILSMGLWKSKDPRGRRLAVYLVQALPIVIAFTVNFGVAALLFLQVLYGQFLYTSSVLMGVFWLGIIPLVIIGYYLAYIVDFGAERVGNAGSYILVSILLIFSTIGFFFSNNMTLMLDPSRWNAYFSNSGGTILNLADPTLWPRYIHIFIGGSAVGGAMLALASPLMIKRDPEVAEYANRLGLRFFAIVTIIQFATGTWFLLALPRPHLMLFMGKDVIATIVFVSSIILAGVAVVKALRVKVWASAFLAVTLVVLMSVMRDALRTGYLANLFHPSELAVAPQYSPLVLFLVSLVLAIPLLVWLIAQARRANG